MNFIAIIKVAARALGRPGARWTRGGVAGRRARHGCARVARREQSPTDRHARRGHGNARRGNAARAACATCATGRHRRRRREDRTT